MPWSVARGIIDKTIAQSLLQTRKSFSRENTPLVVLRYDYKYDHISSKRNSNLGGGKLCQQRLKDPSELHRDPTVSGIGGGKKQSRGGDLDLELLVFIEE